ncbi:MAG TPA: hypothetical protein PKA28_06720 [Methylomusa anaerophila]|nr:hypothetical protein [Methylomusa anaerophila]HML88129.1 hypothetical protein [Methylomusa anaerophila]
MRNNFPRTIKVYETPTARLTGSWCFFIKEISVQRLLDLVK